MSIRDSRPYRGALFLALLLPLTACSDDNDDNGNVNPGVDAGVQLDSLQVSEGSLEPPFDPNVVDYTVRVPFAVDAIRLSASPRQDGATVEIDGEDVNDGEESDPISLSVGENVVEILVMDAACEEIGLYTVTVVRAGSARLTSLGISEGDLEPDFEPDVTGYTVEIAGSVTSITVTPAAEEDGATIRVDGQTVPSGDESQQIDLESDETVVEVEVTSSDDEVDPRVYEITVERIPNGSLESLEMSGGDLEPEFDPSVTDYTATVQFLTQTVQFAPTAIDDDATISIDGVPVTSGEQSDPVFVEVGGNPVAITVTLPGETTRTYVVVVTRESVDSFLQNYVKASNPDEEDGFGSSVALWKETLVVGAPMEDSGATGAGGDEDDDGSSDSGAVYVFVRDGEGWSQQAYLKASNTGAGDAFGSSVAVWEDTLAVGAPLEDSEATGVDGDGGNDAAADSGAVYVFTREGDTWSQEAYLKPANTGALDGFGQSLALEADTLVVGTPFEDSDATGVGGDDSNDDAEDAGAVYTFVRSGEGWSQRSYLKASNTGAGDEFGTSVSLSGEWLAVGARFESSSATGVDGMQDDDSAEEAGAVYVFARAKDGWEQDAYVKASNTGGATATTEGDRFGTSVAVLGQTLAVGAPFEDSSATGIDGDGQDDDALGSGAVYVFGRNDGAWSHRAYVKASNTGVSDRFGALVAIGNHSLAVAAPREDSSATGVGGDDSDDGAEDAGAVFVFSLSAQGTWSQEIYVKAENGEGDDRFGSALALHEDTLAIGARGEDGSASGVGGNPDDDGATDSGAVYTRR